MFARSLSIGPETMVMKFRPDEPMHDRYEVAHDFLTPELGDEVLTISRLVNAFFRWEFNSCECLVRGDQVHPIDYANASPDVALTSLHYYFPWAMKALLKWCTFCLVTGRRPQLDLDTRRYFEIGDREDLSYEDKLAAYRRLSDDVLRGRPLPRLLREPARPRRRARARLGRLGRLRPAAREDRARDVSGARARAVRRAPARARRPVGARERAASRPGPDCSAGATSSTRPTSGPSSLLERRERPGSATSRCVAVPRRHGAARAARTRSAASGRRRSCAGRRRAIVAASTSRCSAHRRSRVARARSGSSETTFISVSFSSECALRFAEPTVSQRSSTIPTLACTYRRSSRSPLRASGSWRRAAVRRRRRPRRARRAGPACRRVRCSALAGSSITTRNSSHGGRRSLSASSSDDLRGPQELVLEVDEACAPLGCART